MRKAKLISLKMAMLERGVTQREVGMNAGIPEAKFSAIINGRLNLTNEDRKKLCQILQKSDAELFKELYEEL